LAPTIRSRTGVTALRASSWRELEPRTARATDAASVDVKPGEYLLEVEGREVRPPAEVYSFFENTAGKADQN